MSEILDRSQHGSLTQVWENTEAASDDSPLPRGEYIARITNGFSTKSWVKETPGYQLTFQVIEGEYAGRRFRHTLWFTPKAIPFTKRDLVKLGVTDLRQLDSPFPQGIRCRVRLSLRESDDGARFNQVRSFKVIGRDEPEPEPFAPKDAAEGPRDERAEGAGAEGQQ